MEKRECVYSGGKHWCFYYDAGCMCQNCLEYKSKYPL